jgi:hypothetical protein
MVPKHLSRLSTAVALSRNSLISLKPHRMFTGNMCFPNENVNIIRPRPGNPRRFHSRKSAPKKIALKVLDRLNLEVVFPCCIKLVLPRQFRTRQTRRRQQTYLEIRLQPQCKCIAPVCCVFNGLGSDLKFFLLLPCFGVFV